MKTTTKKLPVASCRLPVKWQGGRAFSVSIANRKSQIVNRAAFTLIELLVVIAIMAILAAFIFPVITQVKKTEYVNTAAAELNQIATALESYKAKYGVYPPGNALPAGSYPSPQTNSMFSQLYYELSGVTNNGTYFVTLDGSTQIKATGSPSDVQKTFGVGGFINCAKTGDEATAAQNFLLGLKANRIGTCTPTGGVAISNLVTSVRGPDTTYAPVGVTDVNPFRYVYPGVNNPNSYDLYVQLRYRGKMYLVCNWSKTAIINSPLP